MGAFFGFPSYDDAVVGQDGVIMKGKLTSQTDIVGGIISLSGTPTFDSRGMTGSLGAGTSSGISIVVGSGDLAATAKRGTVSFMCSTAAFDKLSPPVLGQNFIWFIGGPIVTISRTAGTGVLRCFNNSSVLMNGSFYKTVDGRFQGNGTGRGSMSQVHIVYDDTGLDIWVDYHKFASVLWTSAATKCQFTQVRLNSSGTSNGGSYTWTNFMYSTKKMVIPRTTRGARIVHFYGDSFPMQGAYADKAASGGYQQMGEIGIGVNNPTPDGKSDAGYAGSDLHYDAGMFATFRRTLAKNGIFTGKIGMWAYSGSGFLLAGADGNKTQDRITTALNFERPDIAVLVVGYNDANQNAGTGPSDLPAYKALVQTSIDAIVAKNPNVIIIICTLPYNASYVPTLTSVNNVNAQFSSVAAVSPRVSIDDKFTQWGGANGSASWFQTNDHPNSLGSQDYGKSIANLVLSRLLV